MLGGADVANGNRVRVSTYLFLPCYIDSFCVDTRTVFHEWFCCLSFLQVTLEIDESKKDEVICLLQEKELACEVVSVRPIQSGNG